MFTLEQWYGAFDKKIAEIGEYSPQHIGKVKDLEYILGLCQGFSEEYPNEREYFLKKTAYIKRVCRYVYGNEGTYEYGELYWRTTLWESRYSLESFITYMEKNRPPEKKFYEPREKTLGVVLKDLEDLYYRKIKFYGLSMPSRVGKSTICLFFLAWVAATRPNSHSAMGGHSGILAKGFYKELMNFITSNEYTFKEIYSFLNPGHTMVRDKSAEEFTITLDEPDRFATITCRGIDGTWTGAVDVSWDGVLYVDDLVRDRQHSLSPIRMEETFQEYQNKMVDRKSGYKPNPDDLFAGAVELMVGTLWNVLDPLERMRKLYEGNPLYRFRRIPALNENDESNFDYEVNGFTTEYFKEIRERLDAAEWMAKYMQQPFVREGLLLPVDALHRFDGNIYEDDDISTIAVCDPSVQVGGDNLSMPIIKYSKKRNANSAKKKFYVVGWVYSNLGTKITVPKVVNALIRYGVTQLYIESNGVGLAVLKELKDEMNKRNVMCKINPTHAPNRISKEDKIESTVDFIKDNFYFLEKQKEGKESEYVMDDEYANALSDATMHTAQGKNKTDDAIDSLSQVALVFKPLSDNGEVMATINPFRG